MLLNNEQITEEFKKEIKICIEMNENENTTTQNLWDTVKAVLRGRFIAIQAYENEVFSLCQMITQPIVTEFENWKGILVII